MHAGEHLAAANDEAADLMVAITLDAIEEGDEEEENDEEDEDAVEEQIGAASVNRTDYLPISFTEADIPQAFSCFSYRFAAQVFGVRPAGSSR